MKTQTAHTAKRELSLDQKDTGAEIIRVDSVSKKFSRHLRHVMLYGTTDVVRNIIGLSSRAGVLRDGEFLAVDDASFSLRQGEALGIIGVNGSGKSTLLKMINGIYMPDRGRIEIKGRVGALIEVGAGFHPMLTGRENIYVNGAILGMSKKEIDRKFKDIVDFADIGDFLDSPVKNYSSGMFVRLGFSVAIHSEPETLLIDEVLTVGDIGFQRRSFNKMKRMRKDGVSFVLVSHNMYSVEGFCDSVLVLDKGKTMIYTDNVTDALSMYENSVLKKNLAATENREARDKGSFENRGTGEITITSVRLLDKSGSEGREFSVGDEIRGEIEFFSSLDVENPMYSLTFVRTDGLVCGLDRTYFQQVVPPSFRKGVNRFCFSVLNQFNSGEYFLGLAVSDRELAGQLPYCWRQMETFTVINPPAPNVDEGCGIFFPQTQWTFE